jgi:hypothetical protein
LSYESSIARKFKETSENGAIPLITFGDLFRKSTEIINSNRKSFLTLWLITAFLNIVFHILNQFGLAYAKGTSIFYIISIYLFAFILHALILVPVVLTADAALNKRPIKLGQHYAAIKEILWPFLITAIIESLLITTGFFLIGFFLFAIPAIILSISLIFSLYFVILENISDYEAHKASLRLVGKRWWRIFARIALPVIIFGSLMGCLAVFSEITYSVLMGIKSLTYSSHFTKNNILYIVIWSLFEIFFITYMLILFRDLQKNQIIGENNKLCTGIKTK